jgi:hypothetical protein
MHNEYIPMVKLSYVADFKQKISEREKVKQSSDAERLFRPLFDLDIIELLLFRFGRLKFNFVFLLNVLVFRVLLCGVSFAFVNFISISFKA